jgi:hypothetical protein
MALRNRVHLTGPIRHGRTYSRLPPRSLGRWKSNGCALDGRGSWISHLDVDSRYRRRDHSLRSPEGMDIARQGRPGADGGDGARPRERCRRGWCTRSSPAHERKSDGGQSVHLSDTLLVFLHLADAVIRRPRDVGLDRFAAMANACSGCASFHPRTSTSPRRPAKPFVGTSRRTVGSQRIHGCRRHGRECGDLSTP